MNTTVKTEVKVPAAEIDKDLAKKIEQLQHELFEAEKQLFILARAHPVFKLALDIKLPSIAAGTGYHGPQFIISHGYVRLPIEVLGKVENENQYIDPKVFNNLMNCKFVTNDEKRKLMKKYGYLDATK